MSRSARCTTVTSSPRARSPRRGLEPEQPAADHHRAPRLRPRRRRSRARRGRCGRRARRRAAGPRSAAGTAGSRSPGRAGRTSSSAPSASSARRAVQVERARPPPTCAASMPRSSNHAARRAASGRPRRPRSAWERRTRSYGASGSAPAIVTSYSAGLVVEQRLDRRQPGHPGADDEQPPAAGPLSRGAGLRAHGLDAHRARLQLRLARDGVERGRRDRVERARARRQVQRAPVERRERDALGHAVGDPRARACAAAAARDDARRARRRARRRAAASAGCSSTNGSGSAATRSGDLPVRVIVCHWLSSRPVVSTSGKSASGASAGGVCGVAASRARPLVGGEAARCGTGARSRDARRRRARAPGTATGSGPRRAAARATARVTSHSRPAVVRGELVVDLGRRPPRERVAVPERAPDAGEDLPVGQRLARAARARAAPARRAARSSSSSPSFSGQPAAGSATCASAAVSVGWWMSCTTTQLRLRAARRRSARPAAARRPGSWRRSRPRGRCRPRARRRARSRRGPARPRRPGASAGRFHSRRISARSSADAVER